MPAVCKVLCRIIMSISSDSPSFTHSMLLLWWEAFVIASNIPHWLARLARQELVEWKWAGSDWEFRGNEWMMDGGWWMIDTIDRLDWSTYYKGTWVIKYEVDGCHKHQPISPITMFYQVQENQVWLCITISIVRFDILLCDTSVSCHVSIVESVCSLSALSLLSNLNLLLSPLAKWYTLIILY